MPTCLRTVYHCFCTPVAGTAEGLQQRPWDWQSLKHRLSGPLQKKCVDPQSKTPLRWAILVMLKVPQPGHWNSRLLGGVTPFCKICIKKLDYNENPLRSGPPVRWGDRFGLRWPRHVDTSWPNVLFLCLLSWVPNQRGAVCNYSPQQKGCLEIVFLKLTLWDTKSGRRKNRACNIFRDNPR